MSDEIVFKRDMDIGSSAAETDTAFLESCFVETPEYREITNYTNKKMIVLGRTGAGKTALLNRAKKEADVEINIKPEVFAFQYIDNAPFIRRLKEEGVNLDVFYKFLWFHEILANIIKNYFAYQKKDFIFELSNFGKDAGRISQLKQYVSQYDNIFFDEGTTEKITNEIERSVSAQVGIGDISKITGGLTSSQKKEIQAKTSQYVNKSQINQLKNLTSILKDYFSENKQRKILVTIDNLDANWTDDDTKYKLINSLLDTIRLFIDVPSLKILIAMRNDVLAKTVLLANRQNEKDESYTIKLNWSRVMLSNLVDKRIRHMFEFKYKKQNIICFRNIFNCSVLNQPGYEYILDRTMMRPRDIISFINYCIKQADDQKEITALQIVTAEKLFAEERLTALKYEWSNVYPNVEAYIAAVKKIGNEFSYCKIKKEYKDIQDTVLSLAQEDVPDEIINAFLKCKIGDTCVDTNIRILLNILFIIGILGMKYVDGSLLYSNSDKPTLSILDFDENLTFVIHPLFAKRHETKV